MDPATAPRHIDAPEGQRHVRAEKKTKGSSEREKKEKKIRENAMRDQQAAILADSSATAPRNINAPGGRRCVGNRRLKIRCMGCWIWSSKTFKVHSCSVSMSNHELDLLLHCWVCVQQRWRERLVLREGGRSL
jgi:hypothetical protein